MKIGDTMRAGYGRSPAVIIVDMARTLTDPASPRHVEQSRHCLENLVQLVKAARAAGIPRFFTKNGLLYYTQKTIPFTDAERGSWAFKNPVEDRIQDHELWEISPELNRQPDEIIIEKTKPSAFFSTPLASYLIQMGIDTLIIGGMVTSNCVMCTVIDAFQYNFRVIVPKEGVADRDEHFHDCSLAMIDSKYGDVMEMDEVLSRLTVRQVRRLDA